MAQRSPINLSDEPMRESAALEPLHCRLTGPSHPDASNEPTLNIDNIQGNILSGFMKDNQAFVFLTLEDHQIANFKEWLAAVRPFIATEAEVIAFNRLFKAIRTRREGEPTGVKATWINIAFSHQGLKKLIPEELERQDFEDEAFKAGLAQRSLDGILGDPSTDAQKGAEGHPDNWVIGGSKEAIHAVIIVASDDEAEVIEDPASKSTLSQLLHGSKDFPRGVASFGKFKVQQGRNLPAEKNLAGHEHFGFLDGVSQPGVRGRLSNDPHDVLTPRQNLNNRDQGKPGQELLWPGEFVFGYQQGPSNPKGEEDPTKHFQSPGPIATAGPDWANDGSFLAIRRLRQDVGTFHQFLHDTATSLEKNFAVNGPPPLRVPAPPGTPVGDSVADMVGARLVGRWRSGAPVERTRHPEVGPDGETPDPTDQLTNDQDNPFLANDDCANNNFEFQDSTEPLPHSAVKDPFECADENDPEFQGEDPEERRPFQPARKDPGGAVCPFTGHIRKAYPRDDHSEKPVPDGAGNPIVDPETNKPVLVLDGKAVTTEEGENIITNEDDTQTHRILRRGIPFGPASDSTPGNPIRDERDERPKDKELTSGRGLVFLAYQTSIVDQFEFIIQKWVNNPDFKEPKGPDATDPPTPQDPEGQGGGHDPIIGQNNKDGGERIRTFTVAFQDEAGNRKAARISTKDLHKDRRDWVIPTGGEYFFAPSIDALVMLVVRT